MNLAWKLCLQGALWAVVGAGLGYFGATKLPSQIAAEMIQVIGNIAIIAGSLVGWSVGWISQSRVLIRDIDYDGAGDLFRKLGDLQKELICRWLIVFVCSILAVFCAVIMKAPTLNAELLHRIFLVSSGLLAISISFVLYLFQRMLALSKLKTKLDEFERKQLRKKRFLPEVKEGERRTTEAGQSPSL